MIALNNACLDDFQLRYSLKRGAAMESMVGARGNGVFQRNKNEGFDVFRSRFLSILTARKEEVTRSLDLLVDRQKDYHQPFSNADFIEDLDQAERDRVTNTYYTLLERKTTELNKIDFLLNKIMKDEDFGLCEECGEVIPEERLFIIPEANLCVPCQRELEKMDCRKKSAARSFKIPFAKSTDFQWVSTEDSGNKGKLVIETDMEGLFFCDLEETELENAPAEERAMEDSSPVLDL